MLIAFKNFGIEIYRSVIKRLSLLCSSMRDSYEFSLIFSDKARFSEPCNYRSAIIRVAKSIGRFFIDGHAVITCATWIIFACNAARSLFPLDFRTFPLPFPVCTCDLTYHFSHVRNRYMRRRSYVGSIMASR